MSARPGAARRTAWAASVVLGAGVVGMAVLARPPGDGAGWRLGWAACAVVACAAHFVLVQRARRVRLRHLLALALGLRVLVFPLLPALSDDGYRYVWDGLVQAEDGLNPYRYVPSDPALAHRHAGVPFERMNSPDYHSVYPPASQAVFAAGGAVAARTDWATGWFVIKGLLVVAEVVGVALLARVVSARAAAVYAWHPLAVFEVAGQGHTEGLLVGALGALLWSVARRHRGLAGAALGLAVWTKLFPILLAPWVLRRGGRRAGLGLAAALGAGALAYGAPYVPGHVLASLRLYGGTFEFYAAPYYALKALVYGVGGPSAPGLASALLLAGWAGAVAWGALSDDGGRRRWRQGLAVVLVGYAVSASTVHPWYLLAGLLAMPLLQTKKAFLWLAAVSLASYAYYVGAPMAALVWAGWGGGGVLLALAYRNRALRALMRGRARRKAQRILRLPGVRCAPTSRVLDLGCGEGFVGDEIAQASGARLVLADVVDFGQTPRPVVRLQPGTLPFGDASFDAVIVVFVLHHARDPESLLREAVRVSRGRVVVWESVGRSPLHRRWLERADRLANRVRSGGAMPGHVAMRRGPDWEAVFEREGWAVMHSERWGRFHAQALYVLDASAQRASTASAEAPAASSQT